MATLRLKYSPEAVVPMVLKMSNETRQTSIRAGSLLGFLPGDLERDLLARRDGGLALS